MADVSIYVFLANRARDSRAALVQTVTWSGQVDWPGAPRPDDTWFHCNDWAGEQIDRVSFHGPDNGRTHLSVEVRTTPDVLVHLRDEHGFEG